MKRRDLLAGAAALAAGGALAGCRSRLAGTFLAADAQPADYPTSQAVEWMGRYLEQRTGGRLSIKLYAGAQLGSETETLEIAGFGGLDIVRVNLAPLNSIAPLTIAASLPFLFRSADHLHRALDGEVGDEILASMRPHGLIGLAFYDSGARSFYNTLRPIRTPADMRAMKIRVPGSDLYVAMVNALGANAVPIAYGEVYQGLAQGVIDGAENNWPSFESARHFEVAPYYSLTRHLLTPEMLAMSVTAWDRLTGSDRALVREAAQASVPVMRQLWNARVEKARSTVLAAGVAVNEVDIAPFSALMRPVWDTFVSTPEQASLVRRIVAMGDDA
ncbi:TRAP transporter substrate-binding protein [Aurantiacibacter spongiae]|uniref:TRAP transporter substrate-binding protein n=2 Tax=Aurantiacibacter spongiae TaxID=2488860 RepID=A0A3N5CUA1_9SPHN|nr:TRAP transporter substrate-binding protein [Aurantiacibacter spongiae]